MYLPFTPFVEQDPSPHGQGLLTYHESNRERTEVISPQDAPDPIRQGDTPARASRMPIPLMSVDPNDWNSGFPDAFLPYYKTEISRYQPAGRQLGVRSQGSVGIRPNIDRGSVAAYGSLFTLGGTGDAS